ncbi:urease accessory protein UreD [Metarhizium album ARSEF 1941]|uniref:Urease accessory protein UreD n=1 Tax=Metarhizium album (strain ARSEF 1941) TaxID=1081103 RepID=A0A0B2WNL7_METAS|nr:urease accessory protein UreD [Metarhizium album ARSEF 1941]KHN94595.1 urease accessory protein UreD [Metarhizium album ARSEF 1941]
MIHPRGLPFPKSSSVPGEGRIVARILPGGASGLESISYRYPLKLISPTSPAGGRKSVLVFLLSYGGGLVAGDAVSLSVHVQTGASLSLVTQGHTKIFKSPSPDVVTSQLMTVRLDEGAALCLLPDPVQPFEDSVYTQTQLFHLSPQSSLCLLDWVTAGRTARGEDWSFTNWTGRNEVWLGAEPGGRDRLLVRDTVILSQQGTQAVGQQLRLTMHKMSLFGTLILRGRATERLASFFLSEFDALPRLGSRDFRTQQDRDDEAKRMTELEQWRARRIESEVAGGVLWSAARVRGCVVVKFGTPTVESGREWIGSMLAKEGSIHAHFGEEALICVK